MGGERGRDLQTNLITSLQNGITASLRIAHLPEREGVREGHIENREGTDGEGRCCMKGLEKI